MSGFGDNGWLSGAGDGPMPRPSGPRRTRSDEDATRCRLLDAVDESIAAYQQLLPVQTFDRATLRALKQALINLSDDIEAFLLHGEPSPDEPYGDDGVDMLATCADADAAAELEPDPVEPEPDPDSPTERRKRMRRVR